MANPKLLKKGGIYRIGYSNWKTNPRPIIFVIYAGVAKVHALSINAPGMTRLDAMAFTNFVKKMRAIQNADLYSPRLLYRILKQYFPGLVRKTYRTFFTNMLGSFSLISYGIADKDSFSDFEKSYYNKALYTEGINSITGRTLSNTVPNAKYVPQPKMPIYTPEQQKQEQQQKIEKQNQPPANKIIQPGVPKPKDGLEDVYGEE